MAEREARGPEDARNWDLDEPGKSGPVRNRRTVVSVSLPGDVFQAVAAAAEEAGLTTSQYIREAAVARASPPHVEADAWWAGSSAPVVSRLDLRPTTCVPYAPEPEVRFIAENAHVYEHD